MAFVKAVIVGLAVCAITYFAIFALAIGLAGLVPISKYIAMGVGIWAMIYYSKEH